MQRGREAKFTTKLIRWIKANNIIFASGLVEVKVSPNGSYPFSALPDHQIFAVWLCQESCVVYKIPDVGSGQKPADIMIINKGKGYYIFRFWGDKRGNKEFYLIPIDKLIKEIKNSKRRSLTETRAKEIGKCYKLN